MNIFTCSYFFWPAAFVVCLPRLRPVRDEAMCPTFLPGGVFLDTEVGFPKDLPPNGWLYALIAPLLVCGHSRPLASIAHILLDAFLNGFSVCPPPHAIPIVARHSP